MYEYGYTVPQGFCHIKRIQAVLDETNIDLPALVVEECRDLLEQIDEKSTRINLKTAKVKELAAKPDKARRLQTMPGVGPITALAVEAFAPEMQAFKRGRDFAAWLGIVPRQYSSGGKERLGRISKAGQSDIRRLLIIGAPLMHVNMHCRAVNVTLKLARAEINPRRIMAFSNGCKEAKDACGNSSRQ